MSLTVFFFAMIIILCVIDLGSRIASQVQMDADGNLTPTEMLVKQAIRQNIRGHMTQPLSMLQWTHLVLQAAFPPGRPADASGRIQAAERKSAEPYAARSRTCWQATTVA